jgi:CBS domain-containing protein
MATASVEQAARLMAQNDVGAIPIVNDGADQKLEGIVTDRDIAVKVVAKGRDPKATEVQEIMSAHPVVCAPDENADEALKQMEKYNVRRVLVIDRGEHVKGIIAISDIVSRVHSAIKTNELVATSNLFRSH